MALVMAVAMILGLMPGWGASTVMADVVVKYLDVDGVMKNCSDYTVIDDNTDTLTDGWYVVESDVGLNKRLTVSGSAILILCNYTTYSITGGIQVATGNALTIFGQSEDQEMGTLIADAGEKEAYAGIGGGSPRKTSTRAANNCGTVTINGGRITATGGPKAAGIGGGDGYKDTDAEAIYGYGGTININGGIVEAAGGSFASGIGGGQGGWSSSPYKSSENYGKGAVVTIQGGTVTAEKSKKLGKNGKLQFESADKSIAKVSDTGKITAVKAGTTYIYAYAPNGKYKKIKVTVQ